MLERGGRCLRIGLISNLSEGDGATAEQASHAGSFQTVIRRGAPIGTREVRMVEPGDHRRAKVNEVARSPFIRARWDGRVTVARGESRGSLCPREEFITARTAGRLPAELGTTAVVLGCHYLVTVTVNGLQGPTAPQEQRSPLWSPTQREVHVSLWFLGIVRSPIDRTNVRVMCRVRSRTAPTYTA